MALNSHLIHTLIECMRPGRHAGSHTFSCGPPAIRRKVGDMDCDLSNFDAKTPCPLLNPTLCRILCTVPVAPIRIPHPARIPC